MGNLFLRRRTGRSLVTLPIERIELDETRPRRIIDEASMRRLAESISAHGIIEPLIVRRTDGGFMLVSGERRLIAAKQVGCEHVPCIVLDEKTASAELALIENVMRSELTVFEEAEAIALLISEHGLTQEEVAERLSCSQSYVANKLRLLRLTPTERMMITENGLSERHARAMLRIKDADRRIFAIGYVIRRRMNVAETEEYVDALLRSPTAEAVEKVVHVDVGMLVNSSTKRRTCFAEAERRLRQ